MDYYDTEWGMPIRDERGLYERICLEGFQAGLSWATILRKRPAFRAAFADFDPDVVATYTDDDVERLLGDAGIIRHRGKIRATITNARATIALREEGASSTSSGPSTRRHPATGRPLRGADRVRREQGTVKGVAQEGLGAHSRDLPESVLFASVTKARSLIKAGRELSDLSALRRVIDLPVDSTYSAASTEKLWSDSSKSREAWVETRATSPNTGRHGGRSVFGNRLRS